MSEFETENTGYRETNPTFVQLALSKEALTGEAPYVDAFDLENTLISFNFNLPGQLKIKIRNPNEEVEQLLINRYKQVNPDKGWTELDKLTQNIFFLKWGYSLPQETNEATWDLVGGVSDIHKVVLYNIKYSLSTAKERIVELHLMTYSDAQDLSWSSPTLPSELKHMGARTVRTSIFETKEQIPITESVSETYQDDPDTQDFDLPTRSSGHNTHTIVKEVDTGKASAVGQFRKPSNIISRHLVKIAGHYLGYGVYVALEEVGTALDILFSRQLYSIVYAKSIRTYSVGNSPRARNAGVSKKSYTSSDFKKLDLTDDQALQFLNDMIASNSSFTRASDQELVIPMPGGKTKKVTKNSQKYDQTTFWGSIQTIFNAGATGVSKDSFTEVEPEDIKIPEAALVACYQSFFTDIGLASFHLEHFDSMENQIEGLKVSQSQTDGKNYVDSVNSKPNANQQALASFDDDANFLLGSPAEEDILEADTQEAPRHLAPHLMHRATKKRLKGKSLLYDETGEWKEHTAIKLSDWTDVRLESIAEGKTPAIPVIQDTILLEDGTRWSGYRTLHDISEGISGYTEYLSDLGQEQVKAILAGRKAASTAANTDAKDDMGAEPVASQPGDFPSTTPGDPEKNAAVTTSLGFIQTEFSAHRLYETMRTICGAIWNKVGADVGKGLRVEIEETGYLKTDDDYAAYLAGRGNFMTVKKLKALFGVIYIAPKDNATFNHKAVPPLPIRSFDIELPDINVGEGETIPIQLSYGFQKRKDSIVKSLDINLESGQLNNMLHVQPEVISKSFNLLKLHSSNFTENIGQITNSMLYILTQNSDVTTTIDEDAIALQKKQNNNEVVVSEGSTAFSQRAIKMVFQTVANYAADPTKFVGTRKDLSPADRAVYEAHLETLRTQLGFLSKGANDSDTEFLTDIFFGPAELAGKKVDFFIGGDEVDVLGNATIEPFKVLVPQTWDTDPISNGAVKAQIAKLAAYRQLRNILSGIKVTILGIPELNRHMSEVSNRHVYLRINNPRDLGTLHWATGYYKINSISHDISTNGGYITALELYVSDFQNQGALANFEQASAAGEAHRGNN